MSIVPLLTREQEVALAQRIERGQTKSRRALFRSPIGVSELLKIGDRLQAGQMSIREVVAFSDQAEMEEQEDRSEEYLRFTLEGIENIRKLFKVGLKDWERMRA
ncbi:MAG: sigma-70 factor domain-containing protein, partial [Pyrinomonadaceae bacterium]